MKLNYMELNCSNGEVFRIEGQNVTKLNISDINESMEQSHLGEVKQITCAKRFAVEIQKEADRPYKAPISESNAFFIDIHSCETLFERLYRVTDITCVTINVSVTEHINKFKTISLPFKDTGFNGMEKAVIGKSGNLYISIACPVDGILSDDFEKSSVEQLSLRL